MPLSAAFEDEFRLSLYAHIIMTNYNNIISMKQNTCRAPREALCNFSAGVGRSGTFIALDHLMQCMAIDRPLDVFGIVYDMRMERCHMVQNEVAAVFLQSFHYTFPCVIQRSWYEEFAYIPLGTNVHDLPKGPSWLMQKDWESPQIIIRYWKLRLWSAIFGTIPFLKIGQVLIASVILIQTNMRTRKIPIILVQRPTSIL